MIRTCGEKKRGIRGPKSVGDGGCRKKEKREAEEKVDRLQEDLAAKGFEEWDVNDRNKGRHYCRHNRNSDPVGKMGKTEDAKHEYQTKKKKNNIK